MPSALLTQEELEALIDGVVREAPGPLRLKATGAFNRQHEEFGRRLAERVNLALDAAGYAWARRPRHNDALHNILVAAIANAGFAHRVGLTSEDETIAAFSRHFLARAMLDTLQRTGTVVVRRAKAG